MKRNRQLIALGIVTIVAPLMLGCGAAPKDTASEVAEAPAPAAAPATDEVQLLYVQTADSAALADGVLRMVDVSPATIFFSDRPQRVAGHVTTDEFVATWGEGEDSFASNPPNATLSILAGDEPQEIVVVLTEPRLEDGDLVYNVEILEGATAAVGDGCSLFIDLIGRPLTPISYAGVARRTTRRMVLY